MNSIDELREIASRTDNDNWANYRLLRNNCTTLLKEKKNTIFLPFMSPTVRKRTYRTTKKIFGWNCPGQPNCFLIGGQLIIKSMELANSLQNYFEGKNKK